MIKIAIVEDDKTFAKQAVDYLKRFAEERKSNIQYDVFSDGVLFLNNFTKQYNLVLLDIDMPRMNGVDVSHHIREKDDDVMIIFLTNLAQYAIKGYEVGAKDFIVKPINYETFRLKMTKVFTQLEQNLDTTYTIDTADGTYIAHLKDILFIDTDKHYLVFHFKNHPEVRLRMKMNEILPSFENKGFALVNRSELLNLSYVDSFTNSEVNLGNRTFLLSRQYKDSFLKQLSNHLIEEKR